MKILVVEDDPASRELLLYYLHSEGYQVIVAEDGQEGFDKAQQEKPELVVTDLSMPRMDGVELIRLLRQRPDLKGVKICVLTAHGSGNIEKARTAGADAVMQKPTPPDTLADVVRQLTGGS